MSNIINVKEERNVLSFVGEVFNIVANSTNFYLKFELDSEWELNEIVTAIFNFDGKYIYVPLDENRMCQIPPTNSSRIWFCITTEPDEISKLSSTILSLDVEASGETDLSHVEEFIGVHSNMMGVVQSLLNGNINAKVAEFANVAGVSQTQVSLTGDEEVAGEKNFTGTLKHNSNIVPDCSEISKPNLVLNANFKVNQRQKSSYIREGEDIYTVDRWGLFKGNGKFTVKTKTLEGLDETSPTVFGQWIEDAYLLRGRTLTISATINDVRYSKTIILPETYVYGEDYINNIFESEDFVFRVYFYVAYDQTQSVLGVQFLVENGKSIVIQNVKVEESDYATKCEERTISEDMALCQRYYQRLTTWGLAYGVSTEKMVFFIPTTVSMRIVGKIYIINSPSLMNNGEKIKMEAEDITINFNGYNGVQFTYTTTDVLKYSVHFVITGCIGVEGEYFL